MTRVRSRWTSPECVAAFEFYGDLIKSYSVSGSQDVDTVRASYFAGQAAMVIWSTFLLDELAGLRNDAKPSCAECKKDPKFLAENTGVVAAVAGPGRGAGAVRRGHVLGDHRYRQGRAIAEVHRVHARRRLHRWVAIAPEGKYPVRLGTKDNPTQYVDAWEDLRGGR